MQRKTQIVMLAVLVCGLMSGVASAEDVMLTQVTGQVSVSGSSGARPAVPLLKITDGDRLTLAADARVQMVYLGSGRQEIWKGTGQVDIGATEGRSPSLRPETTQLPGLILRQLAKTPAVGDQVRRTGMVMVRGLDELEKIDRLEKDYAQFRALAPADDTTPEVFLLSSLFELRDYATMRTVLADLKSKHGGQPAYDALIQHFTKIVDEASAPPPR